MKMIKGRMETWQLAKDAGLADGISKISKHFDIADVCIIANDTIAYVNELPRKTVRVTAVPTKIDYKDVIKQTKDNARKYK